MNRNIAGQSILMNQDGRNKNKQNIEQTISDNTDISEDDIGHMVRQDGNGIGDYNSISVRSNGDEEDLDKNMEIDLTK